MVSPGVRAARKTAWLAWEPEWGWTLTWVAVEKLLGAVAGEVFDNVDELAAAVVAFAGVAFGVFVGEGRGGGGHDGRGDVVFGGDKFEGGLLAAGFVGDGLPELGVFLGDGVHGHPFTRDGKWREYYTGWRGIFDL